MLSRGKLAATLERTLFGVYLWLPSIYSVMLLFHYDSDTKSPFQLHLL